MATTQSPGWVVLEYERRMLNGLRRLLVERNPTASNFPEHVRNAVVESALLHVRVLADILLSKGKEPDDITLERLLPGFTPLVLAELQATYGTWKSGPCHDLNKMLAHATDVRRDKFDYSGVLNSVGPKIDTVLAEIDAHQAAPKPVVKPAGGSTNARAMTAMPHEPHTSD